MKKNKKSNWQNHLATAVFMFCGAFCSIILMPAIDQHLLNEASLAQVFFTLGGLLLGLILAFFLHTIIHEAGHLIFGLLSGYQFASFRIGSFLLIKENEHLQCKRLKIAGTGGQCLMIPPAVVNGSFPVILYNLGGSLLNLIAALLFWGLSFVFSHSPFISILMLGMAVTGFAVSLMNGLPLRTATVDNDGYNIYALKRDPAATHAFWVQLKVSELQSKGFRLKDMPEEWFSLPSEQAMKNSLIAVLGVFKCNRLMDEQKFTEANQLMTHLLQLDTGLAGLYRSLLVCDQMYCELIAENRPEILQALRTKKQLKVMKQMKTFPSILRTEYAYALLCEKDLSKAENIKKQFADCAQKYPYPQEIQAESELIEIAEKIYHQT